MEFKQLYNGVEIPQIMLGTWNLKGKQLIKAINNCISIGYTGFDTARDYGNENNIGSALSFCSTNKTEREKLFITTKIGNRQQVRWHESKSNDFDISLKALQVEYVDLLLMHWPLPDFFIETWRQMEQLYADGKVKAIGVCNFRERHLEKLLSSCDILPMVNQIEIHPLYSNKRLIQYCFEKNILVEAYCPLGLMNEKIINSDILKTIACKYNKTIVQIILRWDIQQDLITIPKSSNPQRLLENISVFDFELNEKDMQQIDSLNEDYKLYVESFYCPSY